MRPRDDHSPARTHLDPPAFEREVEPARPWLRRRRAQRIIVAVSLAVIAASGTVFWLRGVTGRGASDAVTAFSSEVEEPIAAIAADDAIGNPVTGEIADHPDGWLGVAAAPDRYGVIAAWSDHILWISRDDGRTFHQELAAPEPIGAATIAAGARVYVARHGGRFGLLTPAGHTRWLWLDYEQALAIATGGGWTVLLAMSPDRHAGLIPILWATEDDGASWRRLVAPAAGDLGNRLHVGSDGTVDLLVRVTGDLAPRIRHYRGHVDGRPFADLLDAEDPQPFGLGHDGSTARLVWTQDGARLAAQLVFPASSDPPADRLAVSDWDVLVGAGPDWTLAVADRRLLALTGTHVQPLSVEVPGRVRGLTGDGIGRSLALVGRLILRHSTAHGWRRLFELPAVESLPR